MLLASGVGHLHAAVPSGAKLPAGLLLSTPERTLTQTGWSQWAQRGQSELLGAQRLEEDGLGGLKMGQ